MNIASDLRRIAQRVGALADAGFAERAALATITRTRGSTYRKAGASMLICENGEIVCALAGGCPQRDIVQRAGTALAEDRPDLARYNNESGLDVLMEMGCGGELDILIEPIANARDAAFVQAVSASQQRRSEAFLATVFAVSGRVLSPRPKRVLIENGKTQWNDVVDADLARSISAALMADAVAVASVRTFGPAEVLFEKLIPPHALTVIGANEGSQALAELASGLGWTTTIVDPNKNAHVANGKSVALQRLICTPSELPQHVALDAHSSVVVMTHSLEHDVAYLREIRQATLAYVGAIGSRDRVAQVMAAVGTSATPLHTPAGLDIGAGTPEEIALAIAAEIVATLRNKRGGSLMDAKATVA